MPSLAIWSMFGVSICWLPWRLISSQPRSSITIMMIFGGETFVVRWVSIERDLGYGAWHKGFSSIFRSLSGCNASTEIHHINVKSRTSIYWLSGIIPYFSARCKVGALACCGPSTFRVVLLTSDAVSQWLNRGIIRGSPLHMRITVCSNSNLW